MTKSTNRPTEAVIDLGALSRNLSTLRNIAGDSAILAVVKADAYGHGAAPCSARLEKEGISSFGVAMIEEALELRNSGISGDIVILGSIFHGQEEAVLQHRLEPMLCSRRTAESLNSAAISAGKVADIHVKVDTGMSRIGIDATDAADFAAYLKGLTGLRVKGIMSHFPAADDPQNDDFTVSQIEMFDDCCRSFTAAGHHPEVFDIANSPGTLAHSGSRKNMVRLGGGLYGLLDDIMRGHSALPDLEHVMSLRSEIAHVRQVDAGTTVGYGRSFTTERPTRLAAVPIGYADGYPRGLSNRGSALIRGQKAKVAGIVSMDWTIFDVTDIADAAIGDEVLLIGNSEGLSVTAADIAGLCGTIGYEITCGVSQRVPKRYIS
ncbi:MAG: alanine racemase [Acidobacteriota bacterium]|nr:MAG: alanine racemase [Acidobacteriota bacterium]